MAATAHTWTENLNNLIIAGTTVPATTAAICAEILFRHKQFLITNGYVFVAGSGKNGTGSLVYSAAIDPWLSYTDLQWGGSTATARSWILLKSPAGAIAGLNGSWTGEQSKIWILFDCQHGSNGEHYMRIAMYNAAPSLTGASTSVVPSAATQLWMQNAPNIFLWIDNASMTTVGQKFYTHGNYSSGEVISAVTKGVGGANLLVTRGGTGALVSRIHIINATKVQKYGVLDYPYPIAFGAGISAPSFSSFTGDNMVVGWNFDSTANNSFSAKGMLDTSGRPPGFNVTASGNPNGGIPNTELFFSSNVSGKVFDPAFAWADHRATGAAIGFNIAGEAGTGGDPLYHYWLGGASGGTTGSIAFPIKNPLNINA